MLLSDTQKESFQSHVLNFYSTQGRTFPWRVDHSPYRVLVSEIMLQQTQTYRVEPKFERFILTFPTLSALAEAELRDVLYAWQGLGYNRRAMALHQSAQAILQNYTGQLPQCVNELQKFKGIGYATASSICAFAYNMPTVFVETNIRAVFIHTFFKSEPSVADKQLIPLVEQTLDYNNPRQWYYALMDYGVYLKKMHKNPSRRSTHYTKQSRFVGSDRQIRGSIIRFLVNNGPSDHQLLIKNIASDQTRVERIVQQLVTEKLIKIIDTLVTIA